ncbi:hypothetical protein DVA67_002585 [Solirubrobacter sp. CPCC 204708]|uniref:ClpX-type ZB domain-containing protein n=1 Tax=Solirubrobacter deserti TaxID=2282478 RepID=A0ABT4RR72_9ACTN|nr:hypothetical protein [Solirubrobacter deserti]MBE2314848.1 hypothetical protein [Solirubrobacter deserti]MDA0141075.1 hypothetical protein [Solirubrobacter deserti]
MARTRDIRTNQLDVACDICGRTLLRGEHPEHYLAGGERKTVCDLCITRAQHEGWIRESGADDLELRHPRHEGRGFIERFRGRRDRAAARQEVAEESAVVYEAPPEPAPRREREREPAPRPEPVQAPRSASRHIRAVPTNAELKMQRALDVFNASDHTRTVGGVARSLGAPAVCVRPRPDRPAVVSITVMWELSWYRFEVDLSDEAGGVRRDAQGDELSELIPEEQVPNAAADERGALHLQINT